jgi:hypothetical protein
MTETFTDYRADDLPDVVVAYLDARDAQQHAAEAAAFAPDATVIDDGHTYEGIDAITAWIEGAASEFTYTSTRLGQHVVDPDHVDVVIRIDGNFPGGTATLRQRFEVADGRITRLEIGV